MSSPEWPLSAMIEGWFMALDNLHATQPPSRKSKQSSIRGPGHQFQLQMNLFKEQCEWVRLGEDIGLFPRGSSVRLTEHYLLDQYAGWVDPNLALDRNRFDMKLRNREYFARAYSRAVSGLTAQRLQRVHLTHFAREDEWQLTLTEIQVLRAFAEVYPVELASGLPIDQYALYWFLEQDDEPEVDDVTPSSWRDGVDWAGTRTALRRSILHDQFESFSAEFADALQSAPRDEPTLESNARQYHRKQRGPFNEKELLSIANEMGNDLDLMRGQIVRLLRGNGRDRVFSEN